MSFWTDKRITVTGGGGFLGSFVVEKLRERGCRDIFVPRSREYDLVDMEAVKRFTETPSPTLSFILLRALAASARTGRMQENFSTTMR
jgi:GDP-L-fucose synthase